MITPLPWSWFSSHHEPGVQVRDDKKKVLIGNNGQGFFRSLGYTVGMTGDSQQDTDNIEFIVLACNNHYRLVSALQKASELLSGLDTAEFNPEIKEFDEIIATAQGVTQ